MYRFRRFVSLLCIILLMISVCGCSKNSPENVQEQFNSFLDKIFLEEVTSDSLSLNYTLAHPENFGIKSVAPTLGEYSAKQLRNDLVNNENTLTELETYDYSLLSEQNQVTYDILKAVLTNNLKQGKNIYFAEQLGPTTGLQAQLPILLAEYRFYTKDDITNYIKLLNSVDDYFEMICDYEKEKAANGYFMADQVANNIISQCSDFIKNPKSNFLIDYFDEKISDFEGLSDKDKIILAEENRTAILESVIPAYESLIQTLISLKGSCVNQAGLCGFDGGREYYQAKVQATTGSSKTIPQMKAALKTALNQSFAVLTTLGMQDSTLYDQFLTLKFPSNDPNEIMQYLENAIKADFPAIDSVSYSVKYVHKSLQDHLSPAMYLLPPIDDISNNCIYINNTPAYDMTKIFPTIAHEGYPGHLYQNVYFRKLNLHPIRSMIDINGYDEGWATYVEHYSYGLANLDSKLSQFLQANMIAVHCLYSLTDIGIHYDGWTKEEAVNFWINYVMTEDEAESIYYAILGEPGIYLPYSIGYLEIMELRSIAQETMKEKFVLKDFHQFLLDFGPAPFSIIQTHMIDWMSQY